jgi:hypothetical protein
MRSEPVRPSEAQVKIATKKWKAIAGSGDGVTKQYYANRRGKTTSTYIFSGNMTLQTRKGGNDKVSYRVSKTKKVDAEQDRYVPHVSITEVSGPKRRITRTIRHSPDSSQTRVITTGLVKQGRKWVRLPGIEKRGRLKKHRALARKTKATNPALSLPVEGYVETSKGSKVQGNIEHIAQQGRDAMKAVSLYSTDRTLPQKNYTHKCAVPVKRHKRGKSKVKAHCRKKRKK